MNHNPRFVLFGNAFQPHHSQVVEQLAHLLAQHHAQVMMDGPLHALYAEACPQGARQVEQICGDDFAADYAVSLGGDGTFLETARRVGDKRIPIVGVNMGRLGFLANFTPADLPQAVAELLTGQLHTEWRAVLHVEHTEGEPLANPYALNEVAVLKRDSSSMITIRVDIDGHYLTTYQADGLIINTPTGSTGYALSVGGPIISVGCPVLGLVPVAPHSLTARPLTLADDARITLRVESRSHNFLVATDGCSHTCVQGNCLHIRKSDRCVGMVKNPRSSYFHTLRSKLMWGTDVRIEGE